MRQLSRIAAISTLGLIGILAGCQQPETKLNPNNVKVPIASIAQETETLAPVIELEAEVPKVSAAAPAQRNKYENIDNLFSLPNLYLANLGIGIVTETGKYNSFIFSYANGKEHLRFTKGYTVTMPIVDILTVYSIQMYITDHNVDRNLRYSFEFNDSGQLFAAYITKVDSHTQNEERILYFGPAFDGENWVVHIGPDSSQYGVKTNTGDRLFEGITGLARLAWNASLEAIPAENRKDIEKDIASHVIR
ncbi:TPA: hypothetical protein HA246_05645 [Candidatus Woesearchaeota archaeon]|nr:hypothetical protein [Candidatus Woesearchaeota archaeon]